MKIWEGRGAAGTARQVALAASIALIALLVWTPEILAQTSSIMGVVVDESGGVVSGAGVSLLTPENERRQSTRSDATGRFRLSGVTPGSYVVEVVLDPFVPARVPLEVGNQEPDSVTAVLRVGTLAERVDVTSVGANSFSGSAAKTETAILDTPQSIQVVTDQLILERRPASLTEALQNVSGVVDGGSRRGGFEFPLIRGFDATTDVFLDGLRVESGISNMMHEIQGLERVDVLKGPSSMLFGQGTPGGIINMLSKRPTRAAHALVELTGGGYDFYQGRVDAGTPLSATTAVRLNASYRSNDDFVDLVGKERVYIAPAFQWTVNSNTDLTVLAAYVRDRGEGSYLGLPAQGTVLPNINGPLDRRRNIREPAWDVLEIDRTNVGYAFTHRFGEAVQLRQNLRFSTSDVLSRLSTAAGLEPDQRTMRRNEVEFYLTEDSLAADTNATVGWRTGRVEHRLLAGVDYFNQDVHNTLGIGSLGPIDLYAPVYGQPVSPLFFSPINYDGVNRYWGLYVQDQMQIGKRWSLVGGGRYDHTRTSNDNHVNNQLLTLGSNSFVPRVGLTYRVAEPASVFVNYSRSFKPNFGMDFAGTPFAAERGEIIEGGVKSDLVAGRLTSTVAVYKIKRANVLTTDPDPTHVGFQVLTGEQEGQGFEADLTSRLTAHWSLSAAYAYTDLRITRDTTAQGSRPQNVPTHQANLFMSYHVPVGLSIGGGWRAVGTRQGTLPNTFELPGYQTVDAMAAYRFGKMTVQLNATNLFNEDYIASSAAVGGTGNVLIGPNRTALVTVGFGF